MRCKQGHSHPPMKIVAATGNRSRPHGPRPFHCPECPYVTAANVRQPNWVPYDSPAAAVGMGHRGPCEVCF